MHGHLNVRIADIIFSFTKKRCNKLASDIKLVSYSSTITMMHGPINISLDKVIEELEKCKRRSSCCLDVGR